MFFGLTSPCTRTRFVAAVRSAKPRRTGERSPCARAVASAFDSDEELREMTSALPELPERLRELAAMADWAAEQDAQVRLTFVI